jgi:nucleotidyltransferase/DNA polymerase involved in DNA repair
MNLNAVDRLARSEEAYLDVTKNKTGTIREQIRQELNLTASAGRAEQVFGKNRF